MDEIKKENEGIPLYRRLVKMIKKKIMDGELQPHTKLPSEREMCEKYGISRTTVRRAMSELIHEGLVYTSVGRGIYVAEPKFEKELQPLTSFTESMKRRGLSVSSKILDSGLIKADDRLARRLKVLPGTEVVKLHRLRYVEGIPTAIQYAYLPHHLCPDILKYDFSRFSLLKILKTVYGLKLAKAESEIEAGLASVEEAELLDLPIPSAVLIVEQTTYLDSGAVIEFVRSIFPGGRYRLYIPDKG
ncbi:MAG: GntR family transcriptional regulator [Thermotogae bacterium]|nr:GntR family transcriptional regulator [Thermotogota bacterium]